MRRSLISSEQQCKRFVINDSFIVCLVHYVKIITLLLSLKNVIEAVMSEGNLNQIESLRRKITIIGDRNVEIRDRHAWLCCAGRDVT